MDIIILQSESEVLSRSQTESIPNRPSGILNSEYKNAGSKNLNANSIYSKKQLAKGYLYNVNSGIAFALRVSAFLGLFFFLF